MKELTGTEFAVVMRLVALKKSGFSLQRNSNFVRTIGDRQFRKAIHNLRNAGYHIISNSAESGYWLGTDDEWNDFCDRERKAALSRLHRKTYENGRQLRIEVEW